MNYMTTLHTKFNKQMFQHDKCISSPIVIDSIHEISWTLFQPHTMFTLAFLCSLWPCFIHVGRAPHVNYNCQFLLAELLCRFSIHLVLYLYSGTLQCIISLQLEDVTSCAPLEDWLIAGCTLARKCTSVNNREVVVLTRNGRFYKEDPIWERTLVCLLYEAWSPFSQRPSSSICLFLTTPRNTNWIIT